MPQKKKSSRGGERKKPIEQYDHRDKKRVNNPPVGLVTPETDKDRPAKKYAYDPHIDPALQFDSKRSQIEKIIDGGLGAKALEGAKAETGWLFPHRRDLNMPMTTIQKAHEEALKKSKIKPSFRLYDLRHTFGSRSAMAGVDLATLKELMGHSNISITMRYVHPTPEHKQAALRKLERFNVEQAFALHEKQ